MDGSPQTFVQTFYAMMKLLKNLESMKLTFSSFDDESVPEISFIKEDFILPKLVKLELNCIKLDSVSFNEVNLPSLKSLHLTNIVTKKDSFNLVFRKTLKDLSLMYCESEDLNNSFDNSIINCPMLESLSSRKLWGVYDMIDMSFPNLKSIFMSRADSLASISLYAPKLQTFSIPSCYDICYIQLLDTIPNDAKKVYQKYNIKINDIKINQQTKNIRCNLMNIDMEDLEIIDPNYRFSL